MNFKPARRWRRRAKCRRGHNKESRLSVCLSVFEILAEKRSDKDIENLWRSAYLMDKRRASSWDLPSFTLQFHPFVQTIIVVGRIA